MYDLVISRPSPTSHVVVGPRLVGLRDLQDRIHLGLSGSHRWVPVCRRPQLRGPRYPQGPLLCQTCPRYEVRQPVPVDVVDSRPRPFLVEDALFAPRPPPSRSRCGALPAGLVLRRTPVEPEDVPRVVPRGLPPCSLVPSRYHDFSLEILGVLSLPNVSGLR